MLYRLLEGGCARPDRLCLDWITCIIGTGSGECIFNVTVIITPCHYLYVVTNVYHAISIIMLSL